MTPQYDCEYYLPHGYSPLRPYEVPVRVAVGLLPASPLHGLVDGVGEGSLESDGTAPRPPLISHDRL